MLLPITVPIHTKLTIALYRFVCGSILLALTVGDWFIAYFDPAHNAGNWLASLAGGFIARFFFPGQMSARTFWLGWLIGTLAGVTFGPDVTLNGGIGLFKRSEACFAIVALGTDLFVQLVSFFIRLFTKVGDYTVENPGQAFDSGLDRIEKVVSVWVRIKTGALDLVSTLLNRKKE